MSAKNILVRLDGEGQAGQDIRKIDRRTQDAPAIGVFGKEIVGRKRAGHSGKRVIGDPVFFHWHDVAFLGGGW
jgi:hypothetical protein